MEISDKQILVTGATGLIGSNLVNRLLENNNKVFVTGRNKSKLEATFNEKAASNNLVLIEHDASMPIPDTIKDIDYIFHAAGPMERDIVINQPVSVIFPNILGTIRLLDFLKKQEDETRKKGRLIIFSSVTVYANNTKEEYIAYEDNTTSTISIEQAYACYAESKRMAEVIARAYLKQFEVDIVIARLSTVYGYCKNIPKTAFFDFINKALSGEDIIINSSGNPRRDNIYIDDAIEGLLTIAIKGKSGEAYNISSNGDLNNFASIEEIAEIIAKETSLIYNVPPVKVKTKESEEQKPGLRLANEKLKKLGWHLSYSHNEGIKETIMHISKKNHSTHR